MAQLSDDCFAFGGELMPAADALAQLEATTHAVAETETVALRAATGRILAEDVASPRDVPPHDNAAVDGWAVASSWASSCPRRMRSPPKAKQSSLSWAMAMKTPAPARTPYRPVRSA